VGWCDDFRRACVSQSPGWNFFPAFFLAEEWARRSRFRDSSIDELAKKFDANRVGGCRGW
jgi:hypothetical protein